jgi:hypothetical protein
MADTMPSASSAYDKFRAKVKAEAAKIPRPLEVSQRALWTKSIAIEAFEGKREDLFTFRAADGKFGFSEHLVNQLIEYAMQSVYAGRPQTEWAKAEFERGYEAARQEFAKAAGFYTDDDMERERDRY